jgi:hypothetical protein
MGDRRITSSPKRFLNAYDFFDNGEKCHEALLLDAKNRDTIQLTSIMLITEEKMPSAASVTNTAQPISLRGNYLYLGNQNPI